MINVLPGDIAFSGKYKPGLYSRIVMKVTKSNFSHSFIVAGEYFNQYAVLEADFNVSTVPFEREYFEQKIDYYEVYRPTKTSQAQIQFAARQTYFKYSGMIYGFSSIPWFLFRAIAKKFGYQAKKNWSTEGCFCSELVFFFIYTLGGEYQKLVQDFTPDTASPEDLYQLVKARPDLFEFVGSRV